MTVIVNMFGAPGAGKSTTATGLFYLLKTAGKSVEYIPEVAKWFTYEERMLTLKCQPYIHAKQLRDLERVDGKVDIAVTDSPTLLSVVYGPRGRRKYPNNFYEFVIDHFKSMKSINFMIYRTKDFSPIGRNQTEEQSDEIGIEIERMLDTLEIPHFTLLGDENAPKLAMEKVLSVLSPPSSPVNVRGTPITYRGQIP